MLLDMNGTRKKIPKRKNSPEMSLDQFKDAFMRLINNNVGAYCFFYTRNGKEYKYTNCSDREIDNFIEGHEKDKAENLIFDCLDSFFNQSDMRYDAITIEQDITEEIENIVKALIDKESEK